MSLDRSPLTVVDVEDESSLAELDRTAEVVIVDLGVDSMSLTTPLAEHRSPEAVRARDRLLQSFDAFRRLVELERDRIGRRRHARTFILVNSAAVFWNAYVLANLDVSSTTPHSRTRHGVVKASPDSSEEVAAAQRRAERLARWMIRRQASPHPLELTIGRQVEIADLDDYAGFGKGWAFPDRTAVRAVEPRAELSIALGPGWRGPCWLTLSFDEIRVAPGETVEIALLAGGVQIATCELPPARPDEAAAGVRDATHPTIRTPIAWLHAQARARGITKIAPLRAVYHRVVGLRTSANRLLGRKTTSSPEPRFRWRVQLPADVIRGGTVELALLTNRVSWLVDRSPGLPLRSLIVER